MIPNRLVLFPVIATLVRSYGSVVTKFTYADSTCSTLVSVLQLPTRTCNVDLVEDIGSRIDCGFTLAPADPLAREVLRSLYFDNTCTRYDAPIQSPVDACFNPNPFGTDSTSVIYTCAEFSGACTPAARARRAPTAPPIARLAFPALRTRPGACASPAAMPPPRPRARRARRRRQRRARRACPATRTLATGRASSRGRVSSPPRRTTTRQRPAASGATIASQAITRTKAVTAASTRASRRPRASRASGRRRHPCAQAAQHRTRAMTGAAAACWRP